MAKEDVASIFVYLAMLAIALLVGFLVINPALANITLSMNKFLFALIAILCGLLFNVILAELAHIVGAKVGKYKVTSVNFMGLAIYKKDNKWKVGPKAFDGLTGETEIAPLDINKSNPKPYLMMGVLFFLVEFVGLMVLFFVIPDASDVAWLKYAGVIFIAIGGMLTLYDIVPVKLDSITDGYRLTLLSKPINKLAFNEMLRIKNEENNGKTDIIPMVFDDITTVTADVNMLTVYNKLGKKDFDGAIKLLDPILADAKKVNYETYSRALAQKLYIYLMTLSKTDAIKFYNDNISIKERRFISNDLSMESIRAYLLISGLLDDSQSEVVYSMTRKPKAMKRTTSARVPVEEMLYKEALLKVKEAHSDWELGVELPKEEVKEETPETKEEDNGDK